MSFFYESQKILIFQMSLQPELQSNLASAVQLALENCQEQFKWDRWNCPETAFSRNRGPTTRTTKEFAYVLSITSAAIVYVTTRNCSRGNIPGCGCNPHIVEGSGESLKNHLAQSVDFVVNTQSKTDK